MNLIKLYYSFALIFFCISGIYSVIEQIMENFIGDRAKEIEIISNGGGVDGRKWNIQWRDDT
jgi:hypothetical protein